ncbi:addiction module protein [Alteromonas sp. 1_MG-2023]|uniref:addiction module protein n=1 Tax=Alteromonas sp. 1_MG-2023 TaxID=3062669 RepID=UPI0026E2E18E|nr:addiction module protein [Alteromonas sp. 1_MG-2023]MDO6567721.1 addiction module protein [Alteromonas sp. 1_MG-2023]
MKIENLSAIEKVELAQRIWDSVAAEQESIELSKEQAQLLNDRLKSFEADQNFGSSWSDVKSRITGQ